MWERGGRGDCVAAPVSAVPMGLVSSANESVAKQARRFDNLGAGSKWAVSYTHLTLPTNREV